ncbi:hypothetical protein ACIP98_32600 [Streptomyces sp. NPDC088354]|uniref:hypothetical protein n=1 Tax=unclassified Streptomyces TaxID=2593676 RepID=UPI0029B9FD57|nr:hypothetical protein [Streptomyces sp. MI02-7b]MDX3077009.1 hypothetical protein [Streptomyces sp. MI02-7b]
MRRSIAAFTATLAVAGTGACTATAAHTEPKASATALALGPKACANGIYQWFNVERPIRLSALSDVETLGKGGGKFKQLEHRVSWPETAVSSRGPALPSRDVLFSLAKFVGEAQEGDEAAGFAFAEVGREPDDPNASRAISSEGAGRFVMYEETYVVEADFRYTCPHAKTVTTGHAKSWTVEGGGTLECDTRIVVDGRAQPDPAAAREAARLSCGPKSIAARAPAAAGR